MTDPSTSLDHIKRSEQPRERHKLLLTEQEAADMLNMSVRTFRREGVPPVKFRRENAAMKRWHIEDIRAWFQSASSRENTGQPMGNKPSRKRGTRKSDSQSKTLPISDALELLTSGKPGTQHAA
jgi:hypothetical protein